MKGISVAQGLHRDQRGISRFEMGILLTAFLVVASVFAFAVISTGAFTSESKPFLGISWNEIPTSGIRVTDVHAGTPADAADILPDDKIVAIDGQDIVSGDSFLELLHQYSPGGEISLTIHRDSDSLSPSAPPIVVKINVVLSSY